jgi:hypothetical protein
LYNEEILDLLDTTRDPESRVSSFFGKKREKLDVALNIS